MQAPYTQSSLGHKRKTEEVVFTTDDSHNISVHLYHLTLSKLLSSPQRRVGEYLLCRSLHHWISNCYCCQLILFPFCIAIHHHWNVVPALNRVVMMSLNVLNARLLSSRRTPKCVKLANNDNICMLVLTSSGLGVTVFWAYTILDAYLILQLNSLLVRFFAEPPLQRSVVMRNTLKQLEFGIFSHSPSKRIYLDLDESTALNNLHLSPQAPIASSPSGLVNTKSISDPADTPPPQIPTPSSNQIQSSTPSASTPEAFNFCDLLPVVASSVSAAMSSTNQEPSNSQTDAMDVTPSFFSSAQPCSAESLEKMKYAPLSDVEFQSLINSSMDQYSLRDNSQGNRPTNQNHDELDSIMQVLVSMWNGTILPSSALLNQSE